MLRLVFALSIGTWLGAIVSLTWIVTPTAHGAFAPHDARRLLRPLFPRHYGLGIVWDAPPLVIVPAVLAALAAHVVRAWSMTLACYGYSGNARRIHRVIVGATLIAAVVGLAASSTATATGFVSPELLLRDIVIDYRPGAGIRIAPHFYNSDEECKRALDQIAEILRTKAYAKHTTVKGAMPT